MTTALTPADLEKKFLGFMDAWNDHDPDKIASFLTKDVIWIEPGLPKPLYGREAVIESLQARFRAFSDIHWPREDLRLFTSTEPGFAAASWTLVGTMDGPMPPGFAPTGKSMRVIGTCLYELRGDLIARHTIVYDSVDAMQQLGLLPSDDSLAFKLQVRLQSLTGTVRGLIRR